MDQQGDELAARQWHGKQAQRRAEHAAQVRVNADAHELQRKRSSRAAEGEELQRRGVLAAMRGTGARPAWYGGRDADRAAAAAGRPTDDHG
jgi:hypothetical protein